MRKIVPHTAFFLLSLLLALSCRRPEYSENHTEIALRDIGHRLLWLARDSVSRVMPVERVGEGVYQIAFQRDFSFEHDALIALIRDRLDQTLPDAEYVVKVFDCVEHEVFFAFEINRQTDDLLPCSGRSQPEGCYVIQIEFMERAPDSAWPWVGLAVILTGAAGLYFLKRKPVEDRQLNESGESENGVSLGFYVFYPEKSLLKHGNQSIVLSEKETRLLSLLADQQGQILDRSELMRAIWGEEGVIVISRNLDVLVSKLRKKLADDPRLKILNAHAKGYKLILEETV